jgi:hypothetical protein
VSAEHPTAAGLRIGKPHPEGGPAVFFGYCLLCFGCCFVLPGQRLLLLSAEHTTAEECCQVCGMRISKFASGSKHWHLERRARSTRQQQACASANHTQKVGLLCYVFFCYVLAVEFICRLVTGSTSTT